MKKIHKSCETTRFRFEVDSNGRALTMRPILNALTHRCIYFVLFSFFHYFLFANFKQLNDDETAITVKSNWTLSLGRYRRERAWPKKTRVSVLLFFGGQKLANGYASCISAFVYEDTYVQKSVVINWSVKFMLVFLFHSRFLCKSELASTTRENFNFALVRASLFWKIFILYTVVSQVC